VKDLPPNFCYLPWASLDISPEGEIKPCCQFVMNHYDHAKPYDRRFTLPDESVETYQSSEFLNDLKAEFLGGGRPKGCERCWVEEEVGTKSKRIRDYERYQDSFDQYDLDSGQPLVISLGLGNHCNLKCRICSPWSSSKWIREWQHHTGEYWPSQEFHKDPQFLTQIIQNLEQVVHIDFPGGEPLLTGIEEQHQVLQHLIDQGMAHQVSLHYNTNVTVFPDQKFWDLWAEFKNVDIQMSIDGIEGYFEFNRYPAKWDRVYPNIKHYQRKQEELNNIQLSIGHVLSVFTVFYLPEFYQWCLDEGLPSPFISRLNQPGYYRATVFPAEHKGRVIEKLESSSHEEVRKWAELIRIQNDSDRLEKFWEMTGKKDDYRSQDFEKTFPEIYPLLFSCSKR